MEIGGQLHGPAALPLQEKLPVPTEWKAEWGPESERAPRRREEFLVNAGNRTTISRLPSSRPNYYTD